jgi:hypothetical protein
MLGTTTESVVPASEDACIAKSKQEGADAARAAPLIRPERVSAQALRRSPSPQKRKWTSIERAPVSP